LKASAKAKRSEIRESASGSGVGVALRRGPLEIVRLGDPLLWQWAPAAFGGGDEPRRHADDPLEPGRWPTSRTVTTKNDAVAPLARRVPIPGAMGRKAQRSRHDADESDHDRQYKARPPFGGLLA